MFCTNCGNQNDDMAVFCGKCGNCLDDLARFCPQCGAPLERLRVANVDSDWISEKVDISNETTLSVERREPPIGEVIGYWVGRLFYVWDMIPGRVSRAAFWMIYPILVS